jgi:serine protease Do/serine protease DegQ
MSMRLRLALAALAALLLGGLAPAAAQPVAAPTRSGLPSLAPLLEGVTPAVVNIAVITRAPMEDNPLARDPFFRRFFNLPDKPREQVSAGSGVIVDAARGLVLTNHHVIANADSVVVTLKDKRQFQAKVIGSDPGTDIAVLKIEAERLSAMRFGDSEALAVGDFVVAIGNPFGIGQTVTSGIVSALGRTGLTPEGYEDFIQTDASINPGNSGGALVDLRGELVGINSAIIGPSGGNVGIGFAVPAHMVRIVMDQIVRFGEVKRGRLGLTIEDVTHEYALKNRLASIDGALISVVQPGSPAEQAGLRAGDVVVRFNGKPVRTGSELRNRLGLTPVGENVELAVQRGGAERTIRTQIAPPQVMAVALDGQIVPQLAGLKITQVERVQAVVVAAVEAGSRAAGYGLRRGDLIVAVANRRVRTIDEFVAALRTLDRGFPMTVVRGEVSYTLFIR